MVVERIYVCTSKASKLYRIYTIQTGDIEKEQIMSHFEQDFQSKVIEERSMDALNGKALIEDIPYYVDFPTINSNSYLFEFKDEIEKLLLDPNRKIIQFQKHGLLKGEITNFDENEGIKFLIVRTEESLIFLGISSNAIIKNKPVISFSLTDHTTVVNIPRGIQVPNAVTARFDLKTKRLYVYDVNRFESMLTLNENRKAKSQAVLTKFDKGIFKIGEEDYKFCGLNDESVKQKLFSSARSVRRLSKYSEPDSQYSISKIKTAVNRLDENIRVVFDDQKKEIQVTKDNAFTFVAIINNIIVERLISGEIEIIL